MAVRIARLNSMVIGGMTKSTHGFVATMCASISVTTGYLTAVAVEVTG